MLSRMPGLVVRVACIALFVFVLSPLAASAQVPDEFTNLKLLAGDVEKPKLVAIMRDWASGLGVRCAYCHVGPDNLQGMDFASDEKATKRTARKMLEMSFQINRTLLAELPTVSEDERQRAQVVSCYTCHRGQPRPPRNILVELSGTYHEGGVEAATTQYRELREEHYGRGRYDFGKGIVQLANRLMEGGKLDDAITALRVGLEDDPESADLHATLGLAHLRAGRLDEAEASLKRALELDPENGTAQWGMSQLEKAKASPEGE